MNKKLFLGAFVLLALAQWYVPLSAIRGWERVLAEGQTYKFQTAPVDPSDIFRGKYIRLYFRDTEIGITKPDYFNSGSDVYLTLGTDSLGYATFLSASAEAPVTGDFLKAKAGWTEDSVTIHLELPFHTYYMEESKAGDAELAYQEAERDTAQVAYAVVKILNGKSVLQDVMINEKPILEVVEELRRKSGKQSR